MKPAPMIAIRPVSAVFCGAPWSPVMLVFSRLFFPSFQIKVHTVLSSKRPWLGTCYLLIWSVELFLTWMAEGTGITIYLSMNKIINMVIGVPILID